MSGSKNQGAGLQQDLEKTTTTVQRNGRLRGFEAKMRHFAFALEQGGQRSQHLANQIINTMMIIFSKICCHHRIDALMGLTGLTSGRGSNQPCVKKGFLAHLTKRRVKNKKIKIEEKKCACRHSRKGRGTSP